MVEPPGASRPDNLDTNAGLADPASAIEGHRLQWHDRAGFFMASAFRTEFIVGGKVREVKDERRSIYQTFGIAK
jgi:hypothetical protein